MNELFIQNPLGDSQLAESCGLGALLPNQQAKYAQLQPNYPPVISPPVQTTVIDTSTVQELVPMGTKCELTLPDGTQKVYRSGSYTDSCPL